MPSLNSVPAVKVHTPVPTVKPVGPRAFALRLVDRSMYVLTGRPTYPEGCLVIVDPDVVPRDGQRVAARCAERLIVRQLEHDRGAAYLVPLNRHFERSPVDHSTRILGTVVDTILEQD